MINKLKIIILGDINVGKSTFLESYITDYNIKTKIENTLISDLFCKDIIYNNEKIKLLFYDFSGTCQSKNLNKGYFDKLDGLILMFDLTNKNSIKNIKSWVEYSRESVCRYNNIYPVPCIIVGNKIDLIENIDDIIPKTYFINEKIDLNEEYLPCSSIQKTDTATPKICIDKLLDKIKSDEQIRKMRSDNIIIDDTIIIDNSTCSCISQ